MTSVLVRQAVAAALAAGGAVVALESTLIAHGLPRPDNLELAREVEAIVREEGATPATVAVLGGVPCIGLDDEQLRRVAETDGISKLSAHDLPVAMALGADGATTVAGTATLAAQAGIRLFATGGLGGVHRGAAETWDVSGDLETLARTRIGVVCAGVKSILDVGATLERLETLGVPVVGFRTRRFPLFYVSNSEYELDWQADDEAQVAKIIQAQEVVNAGGSALVIANPIPESQQLDPQLHDKVLVAALMALEQRRIRGKAVTPFLLDYFRRETGGESLRVNKQIIRNNARLAARIAVALAEGRG
ncbi:MAG: Indigoidine synthase A-like protein, uncharacterized enzyme involved in pigment biosynthesis [uncultured Chloroflexi bacterium]|uniref:Pseudouridine-5'-phosphate glycosidase n=1 Tax=uncultured Chloroflexota bacterium TaxID=166587 RepID=A0A6J4JZ86_9CHLR|nr:MAG: Indigoidine synthase A-like protein, uncharacterized enzyme involved in pigment biosynthesis [uncultured Chloroflexota bacterium]